MAAPPSIELQTLLQTAVQSVQWTYSVFWQICPQQENLVWGDGYYNGTIKTRKTVQPMDVNDEDECPLRSQQLRELYHSLIVGKTTPTVKRPCVALSPEDLTESEWFYLMCASFSFPPGVGLPGKTYSMRQHVWLSNANEVDSNTFCRTILAKSAGIQTVLCIPLLNGVVEIGSVDEVEEDLGLVQRVKYFFSSDCLLPLQRSKPALSGHSPSASAPSLDLHNPFNSPLLLNSAIPNGEEEDKGEAAVTERYADATISERNEIVYREMEDIRVGSPEDESNNLELDFQFLDVDMFDNQTVEEVIRSDMLMPESNAQLAEVVRDARSSGIQSQSTAKYALEEDQSALDDDHYSETISTILQYQSCRWANSRCTSSSTHSSFARWTSRCFRHHIDTPMEYSRTSQQLLKRVLFNVALYHADHRVQIKERTPHDDFTFTGSNHVLAERRRREKLNERFIVLKSLVPSVTKTDKASIVGNTIEYVKQLRDKIQDLEARNWRMHTNQLSQSPNNLKHRTSGVVTLVDPTQARSYESSRRKMRIVEGSERVAEPKAVNLSPPLQLQTSAEKANVQVSIIGSDALIELKCPYKEGLLLGVVKKLRELEIEITTIQSFSGDGVLVAELNARVKEEVKRKRLGILEVKRAIQQIISYFGTL